MHFLVDAQLPMRLRDLFLAAGHNSVHTSELPDGDATTDKEINRVSVDQQRVVVTKDSDFVESLLLHGEPCKLLLVSTGNISNDELVALIRGHLNHVVFLLASSKFVELQRDAVIDHG